KEVIPHRADVLLEHADLFANHLVVTERANALQRMRVIDLKTGKDRAVEVPEEVCSLFGDANPEFDTPTYRFRYQSLVTPDSVFELDLASGKRTLLKQTEVLGGYDPSAYVSERTHAVAKDGTRVPVSLVYKKGLKRDGTAPLLLYGYGSYGSSLAISFNTV